MVDTLQQICAAKIIINDINHDYLPKCLSNQMILPHVLDSTENGLYHMVINQIQTNKLGMDYEDFEIISEICNIATAQNNMIIVLYLYNNHKKDIKKLYNLYLSTACFFNHSDMIKFWIKCGATDLIFNSVLNARRQNVDLVQILKSYNLL